MTKLMEQGSQFAVAYQGRKFIGRTGEIPQ